MVRSLSSIYPSRPSVGIKVLSVAPGSANVTFRDRAFVYASSLFIVGSVVWVPLCYAWAYRKWKATPKHDKRRRAMYMSLLLSAAALAVAGPHRTRRVGRWLKARQWSLWRAWMNFIAFEVVSDRNNNSPGDAEEDSFDVTKDQAILAIIPHGIVPFALAFSALPEAASRVFGEFRPVVATATAFFPFVRSFLGWIGAVDASRPAVDRALAEGSRIGLAPGGIAEMFEGYPKPRTHRDDECTILESRKGFVRMAVKHGVPVVPVYCFGATKMLKRLQLPAFVENLSNLARISICVFFGRWGLPIPFRQKLLYLMGNPIFPPEAAAEGSEEFQRQVDEMHKRFCDELIRIFDRHKESYGWGNKTLRLV